MAQITTQIGGIQRNVPGNSVLDGSLNELIGMRKKDGVLKPVGDKRLLFVASNDLKNIITHSVGNTRYFVAYNTVAGTIVVWTSDPGQSSAIATIGTGKDIDLRVMGNTIIIVNRTDMKLQYMRHNGTYKFFELPEMPMINFWGRTELSQHLLTGPLSYPSGITGADYLAYWNAKFTNSVNKWQKAGYFEGYVLITYCFELVDESFLFPSMPQLIYVGNPNFATKITLAGTEQELNTFSLFQVPAEDDYANRHTAGKLQYSITRATDYTKHRDIIKGVSIFITYPEAFLRQMTLSEVQTYTEGLSYTPDSGLAWAMMVNEETTLENMLKKNIFFKVKSIDLDKVLQSAVFVDIDIKVEDIKTSDILPVDSFTHHKVISNSSFIYNNRLCLANTATKLFNGYSPMHVFQTTNIAGDRFMLEWELKTSEGTKIVRSEVFGIPSGGAWPHIISYPDNRAVKCRLLYDVGQWANIVEFDLIPHQLHNFAYAIIKGSSSTYPTNPKYVRQTFALPEAVLGTNYNVVNNILLDKNRVQISEPGNPFIFPAKNSYQVGIGEALDITSNSDPISQGQFGQYPLLVFCKDGVWALQISTGEAYISNITPFNGEILSRTGAYFNTGEYIVFIDSDYNVKIMAGRQAIKISDPILYEKDRDLMALPNFLSATNHPQTCKVDTLLCSTTGKEYIKSAIVGYDRDEKEIIISNAAYPYTFIYSTEAKQWYKAPYNYKALINDYPNLLGISSTGSVNVINDEIHEVTNQYGLKRQLERIIYLETMPLKFSADVLKQIDRIKLVCEAQTYGDTYFSLLIYGSVDGLNYHYIGGKQVTGQFSNIVNQVKSISCKYFKIIVSGTVYTNSSITSIITEVESKYSNKLR